MSATTANGWPITASLHDVPDCLGCISVAESAVIHAQVTGSTGATYEVARSTDNGPAVTAHSATVTRPESS